ncbi:MAG: 50S ribosomal protein L10 [Candidatus Cloacimonadota bacterium]|nr:MAG: 50S ribosomal protein L10 [Candidatus Cloacimonadota bacterium]
MNKAEKSKQIKDFEELYKSSQLLVMAENKGLDAQETFELRSKIHQTGGTLRVFKNTLAKKAMGEDVNEDLETGLKGPNMFLFGGEDFVDDLKGLMDFSTTHSEKLVVKCGTLDGEYVDAAKLKVLSTLPTKDQLRAQVLNVMLSPITGFVRVLNGTTSNFVNVINNIKSQKEEA